MENHACSCAHFSIRGWSGVGWDYVMYLAHTNDATLLLHHWLRVGGVGWDNNVHVSSGGGRFPKVLSQVLGVHAKWSC